MEDKELKPIEPKSDKQKVDEFVKDYKALCERHKLRIVTQPVFVTTNHGSFELTLQTSVEKLPQ